MSIIKFLITSSLVLTMGLFSEYTFAEISELNQFGDNPGDLEASYYTPISKNPAIVVLLHGCAQNGEELAQQSGLLGLAKKHEFSLLIPQQGLTNNIKRCFNWYSDDDYTKNAGESLSIKNMIITLKQQLGSESVYIIGLSGGGAMASAMLVNYPNLFTGGAIVAGIPFPCANGLITGISCMKNGPLQTTQGLVELVKELNPKQNFWPKLSVWTGAADDIVNPINSSHLAEQWALLSNITAKPSVTKKPNYKISSWVDAHKQVQIELVEIDNLGHGIMVNPNVENGGEISDYLLDSPISTIKHVVKFWGIY